MECTCLKWQRHSIRHILYISFSTALGSVRCPLQCEYAVIFSGVRMNFDDINLAFVFVCLWSYVGVCLWLSHGLCRLAMRAYLSNPINAYVCLSTCARRWHEVQRAMNHRMSTSCYCKLALHNALAWTGSYSIDIIIIPVACYYNTGI